MSGLQMAGVISVAGWRKRKRESAKAKAAMTAAGVAAAAAAARCVTKRRHALLCGNSVAATAAKWRERKARQNMRI